MVAERKRQGVVCDGLSFVLHIFKSYYKSEFLFIQEKME